MSDLPEAWSWTTVRDITLPVDKVDPKRAPHKSFTYVDISSIDSQQITEPKTILGAQAPSRARQLLRSGDTVFSTVRTYLRNIGYVGDSLEGAVASTGFSVLRPARGISSRYLYYYALTRDFVDSLSAQMRGTSYPAVVDSQVRDMPVPVAPTAEQDRIVEAIEEQFSRLDAGVGALARTRQALDALISSIIMAAVPAVSPPHWRQTTVGEAGKVMLGRQRSPKYHTGPKMRKYLRVANVFEDRIDTSDVMSMHFEDLEFERYRLHPNDVLLNEGQSPHLIGRPAMYRGDPPDVAFTNSLLRFQAGPSVLPGWALLVFRRHLHAKRFMRESRITTNIAHLSASRFKGVEFPIPPIAEQAAIVKRVDLQLAEMDRVDALIMAEEIRATALRSSILAVAFSGQLVPQDPSDEPARVLLERIAADKASVTPRSPPVSCLKR